MAGNVLSEQQVMERLGISKGELDSLVQQGRLRVIEREGQRGFDEEQVAALQAERAGAGAGLAETAAAPEAGRAAEEEIEADELFDFSEELETELSEEPGEKPTGPAEAPQEVKQPPEEEGEMATEVVDVSSLEGGESDLLGDVIEDVSSELEPLESETAQPAGEATAELEPSQEPTAEITDLERETAGAGAAAEEEAIEDQELEEILGGEEALEEGAEEAFEVPYEAPAAAPTELPVPGWAVVMLAVVIVVQAIAALFVVENAVSPRYASSITKTLNLFKGQ